MGQAMEIDILFLEVHSSKTLLLAIFYFVNGAKLPKDLPFLNF